MMLRGTWLVQGVIVGYLTYEARDLWKFLHPKPPAARLPALPTMIEVTRRTRPYDWSTEGD